MGDEHTRRIFEWQQQVLADHRLMPLATRVALALSKFVNRKNSKAWPSHATLVSMTGASRRGVQKALDQLERHGHLEIEVNRGRGHPNRYRPVARDMQQPPENAHSSSHFMDPGEEEKCAPQFAPGANPSSHRGANPSSHNLSEEQPSKEPSEETVSVHVVDAFEKWWGIYPKRVSVGTARKAFNRALKKTSLDNLCLGAERYAAECAADRREFKFIRSPVTWLDGECWTDEPMSTTRGDRTNEHRQANKHPVRAALDVLDENAQRMEDDPKIAAGGN